MFNSFKKNLLIATLIFLLAPSKGPFVPITGTNSTDSTTDTAAVQTLAEFTAATKNGNSRQVVGLYAEDEFALPIVLQPNSNSSFVSREEEKVTYFSMTANYGSIGLVAHNDLAGKHFFDLQEGDQLILVYGDGHQNKYEISHIYALQALSPTSPYSKFTDPETPQNVMSVEEVFTQMYGKKGSLVLQTCIAKDGVDSWGRLFIVAEPEPALTPAQVK
jgi:hypothetical protein